MTVKLLFQMLFSVFSLNPKNMRWFNLRRIAMCLFLIPFFIFILVINNIFLLLDYIIFPHFLWQKTKRPVFIIAAPRSATTYLFHSLSASENFTYFKLWEIIFAPSICQKHISLFVLRIDRLIGCPAKNLILFIENKLIGRLKKIHLIGLNQPEEDEAVLLWSLSSFYLNFYYPDSTFFDDLALFDDKLKPKRKARIMRSYANYVKRHNFVFNRKGEKQYLSKNPLMMCKIESLATIYPDALILNINRSPAKTLPSTLELNRNLYGLFTSRPVPPEIHKKTVDVLIEWYKMAEKNMKAHFSDQHLKIDFIKLVTQDSSEVELISNFLGTSPNLLLRKKTTNKKHKSENNYKELNDEKLKEVLFELPFMNDYCK